MDSLLPFIAVEQSSKPRPACRMYHSPPYVFRVPQRINLAPTQYAGELRHAVNMLSKTDLISNESWFVKSMTAEVKSWSLETLKLMGIDKNEFLTNRVFAEEARDEIFSDLYAHMTPGLLSNNPFSQTVRSAFAGTFAKMMQHTEIIR